MAKAAPQIQSEVAALPAHIAIIMDGNGRWAKQQGIARVRGHKQGAEAIRTLLEACKTRPHIKYITLYAFSTENWNRPKDEVSDLMELLRHYIRHEAKTMHKEGVRLRFIGDREALSKDIQKELADVEAMTAGNTALTLVIALSYGSRQELANAMKRIGQKIADGSLKPDAVTEQMISEHLDTSDIPDPDLLIRTGGDERLSNFLLWQSAYTELYFTEVLWPDFSGAHLDKAIECFSQRERRFGARNE
ncbi:MAG: isoprenyl transferase [Alphaproteobacteria bacterium]|nr:isoprenyl transferase [Alphaproteobacteria bacterium]